MKTQTSKQHTKAVAVQPLTTFALRAEGEPTLRVGAATAALALAIVFVLTVAASQPAQAQTFSVIHTFSGGSDGGNPGAGLTIDGAGNLYGTAASGGTGYGTVYKLKPSGSNWVFNPLFSFNSSDGDFPEAPVIFGPDGTLYGTTDLGGSGTCNTIGHTGCGVVFRLRPSASACKTALCPWTETVLYAFSGGADGAYPAYGSVIFDQTGNLYGTTYSGGMGSCGGSGLTCGTVYELTPSTGGWTESVLYTFAGAPDAGTPGNGVIFDSAGNLYSTTEFGGLYGQGTVFQLVPSKGGWTENLLHSFQAGTDGAYTIVGLIFDLSGNLYGATPYGGTGGGGTVFEMSPSSGGSWTYSLLYSFIGGTDCGPHGNLVMDGAGNLYGTTRCDGANNLGSVFKLTPAGGGWTYSSLHDFTGGSDGKGPYSNVVFDAKGNLYGTALSGGSGTCNIGGQTGCGVVWEITFP